MVLRIIFSTLLAILLAAVGRICWISTRRWWILRNDNHPLIHHVITEIVANSGTIKAESHAKSAAICSFICMELLSILWFLWF